MVGCSGVDVGGCVGGCSGVDDGGSVGGCSGVVVGCSGVGASRGGVTGVGGVVVLFVVNAGGTDEVIL